MRVPYACAFSSVRILTCSGVQKVSVHSFQLTVDYCPKQALNRVFGELRRRRDKPWLLADRHRLWGQSSTYVTRSSRSSASSPHVPRPCNAPSQTSRTTSSEPS